MSSTSTPDYQSSQNKDNQFKTELETIFEYLKKTIATGSMVAEVTGVKQKNFCRYKRDLELSGYLKEVKKDNCKVTGFKAWYVTTNPDLFPRSNQTKLF